MKKNNNESASRFNVYCVWSAPLVKCEKQCRWMKKNKKRFFKKNILHSFDFCPCSFSCSHIHTYIQQKCMYKPTFVSSFRFHCFQRNENREFNKVLPHQYMCIKAPVRSSYESLKLSCDANALKSMHKRTHIYLFFSVCILSVCVDSCELGHTHTYIYMNVCKNNLSVSLYLVIYAHCSYIYVPLCLVISYLCFTRTNEDELHQT